MPTVTELEARARIRADQDNSTFPTSAQYLVLIADAAEELWNRMVAAGCKPAQTAVQIAATGASSYAIGTNVLAVLSVERHEGAERLPLRRAQEEILPHLRSLGTGPGEFYDLVGGATSALTLELFPNPASGTYTVRYVPRFTRFTAGSDNWYGPPRSDEYVVLSAAMKALRKEGDDARDLESELAAVFEDVVRMAPWQDAQSPGTIADRFPRHRDRRAPFDHPAVRDPWDF